jgi:hypothetical protein
MIDEKIPYNTSRKNLSLPEYGRHLQNLVDYCVKIPDRDERTACAYAIVEMMPTLFPEVVGENGDMSKAWDQLNIMSGFKLDIDFPCEVITSEQMNPKPNKIPYTSSKIRFRSYGKNIEKMVEIVADMEDGPEKDNLVSMIAHHIKKQLLIHNKEGVDDAKVLRDLSIYSHGKINLDPETYILHEFREAAPVKQQGGKKKKKK